MMNAWARTSFGTNKQTKKDCLAHNQKLLLFILGFFFIRKFIHTFFQYTQKLSLSYLFDNTIYIMKIRKLKYCYLLNNYYC